MSSELLKEKVIRDAVHGDILVQNQFVKLIDTPEFQRLRRIRQLGPAFMVYPTADHTRFSHSIGTYQVMKLIIDHFRPIFRSINVELEEREVKLALAVALLHDIGHGPFSHVFENAIPQGLPKRSHEDWTIEIITSPGTNINKILIENFDKDFPEDLANLIKPELRAMKAVLKNNKVDLFFVLTSLISSQLDTDRMDYLLRDAHFTGVLYGHYDISRLIASLTIDVYDNKFCICIKEKYLTSVEDYITARYQMHNSVYFHPFKCQMELVIQKILLRAFVLYKEGKLKDYSIPKSLVSLYKGKQLTLNEYLLLDDSTLLSAFSNWKDFEDKILSILCSSFLDRKKYKQISILNNSENDFIEFKNDLDSIFRTHNFIDANSEDEYFLLFYRPENEAYKIKKKNILVLKNDGTFCDITETSKLITDKLKEEKNMAFINFQLLKEKFSNDGIIEEVKDLIKLNNNRSHIEIEKKYCSKSKEIFENVIKVLDNNPRYKCKQINDEIRQVDNYYDTIDSFLLNSNRTLRIRMIDGKYTLTVKSPAKKSLTIKESTNEHGQSQRFEFEKKVDRPELNKDYILNYVPELRDKWDEIKQTLTIENNRKCLLIREMNEKNEETAKYEIVFDDVTYILDGKRAKEYQIEIELKSDFIHRINLKVLTDFLEEAIDELIPCNESKYKRAFSLLKN